MEIGLNQRQGLAITMTTQLSQAIELLTYSTYELGQFITQQELENPLIELQENTDDHMIRRTGSAPSPDLSESLIRSSPISMRDELTEQARFTFPEKQTQRLVTYLINNLDDNGYLREIDEDVTFSVLDIDNGIELLQQVGPLGIGARNLKECLLLQLKHNYPENKKAELLVRNHLQLLADHKWNDIASHLLIPLTEVKSLCEFIQTLNPRPCSNLSTPSTNYWIPDIIVESSIEGLTFRLNDQYLPTIQVNQTYMHHLHTKDEASNYINEHYKNVQWLLSSIEQRKNTIRRIMEVLLDVQVDFFNKGRTALKPLTLKDVAERIVMHESTVSRATMNKVIQTPVGSFDLRTLFTTKVETMDGDGVSQTKVKALVATFIAQENKFKPYSDQKIAEYFNSTEGITISRRTIAKYREELRIPPSSKRKEITIT